MARKKERLDRLLARRGLFASREQARRAIMAGRVRIAGRPADKPGTLVALTTEVELVGPPRRFVSRGGDKLDQALDHFRIRPEGWVCLDVGASTGGFTDCLLQRGARRVYALDVGRGQLDQGLRQDPRVVVMEGRNARHLEADALPEPALHPLLAPGGLLLPLIKPQFEAGRREVGKGGVVRDEAVRTRVVREVAEGLAAIGFELKGIVDSSVRGAKGNREAFACLERPS